MADEPSIPPAEGKPDGVEDFKVLSLDKPETDTLPAEKPLDELNKDELNKLLENLNQGPVNPDNEARKIDVAYRLRTAK